jgi:creatinine amidohydrolase
MTVHRLAEMTWEEVRDINPDRAIAVLPLGAIEAHGPHLPLSTDVIISEAMARDGAEKLCALNYEILLLPALSYTAAEYGAAFAGTIALSAKTAADTIVDIARGLKSHGITRLALANSHLDPTHLKSIYSAKLTIEKDQILTLIFPDITRKPWALRLTEEFKSGACHAGQFEGSVVMAERPDLVREDIRKSLPENDASLSKAIREGRTTFESAGGPRAYFGKPADATPEEGKSTIAALGTILAEAISDTLP